MVFKPIWSEIWYSFYPFGSEMAKVLYFLKAGSVIEYVV